MMDYLHVDIWVSNADNDITNVALSLYSRAAEAWKGVDYTVQSGKWNSLDIDLSTFKANKLSPVTALNVCSAVSDKNSGSGFTPFSKNTSVYIANVYFYADNAKPMLSTSVKQRTSNSIIFLAKATKSKDTTGDDITYTVTYGNETNTFTARSGIEKKLAIESLQAETEYTFTIKVKDAAGIESKAQTETVKTLKETASSPTSIPAQKTGYGAITELYTKGEKKNGYNWYDWGGSSHSGKDVEIGDGKAFLIESFTYYGSGFTKIDGTDMTLHIDVYPLQDLDLAIIPITNDGENNKDGYGQTFYNLKRGVWQELELTLNDFKDYLSLKDLYQIKYVKQANIDGTGGVVNAGGDDSFYVGNVYLYNKAADDGETPTVNIANVSNTTVASATFSIIANDNSEELTFKVIAKDENDNETTGSVKGKSGNTVYVTLNNLDVNTDYTATVTVSDKARTSEAKVISFTTKQLPHATKPNASIFYYENDKSNLEEGFLAEGTGTEAYRGFVDEINIGDDDNVLKFSGKNNVFGLRIKQTQEFGTDKKDNIVGIAIYPIDITEIQVAPRIYGETDVYETKYVRPNEWNYITIKPLESYEGNNAFIGIMFKGANGNTVFVDNFYMYTSDDVTEPKVTLNDISDEDVHVNSVKISFSGSDETSTDIKYEIWLKNTTDNETEYQTGFITAARGNSVTYYQKGLKAGKAYEVYVRARDNAENAGKSEVKTFTTKSFTDNISISSCSTPDTENGGLVVLKGKWNVEEFNKIAAEYPYGCFDVRNVQFDDNIRHDRGADGIQLFNHNAYFITDVNNNFDGNYVIPNEKGEFIGMNFQWFDGDYKPANGPAGYVDYQDIIDNYKKTHSVDTYPGLSDLGYIKMDPYTGYDLYFKEQGASITRQMFMNSTVGSDNTGGANKYSTMICPFALNTDNVPNCDFFELNTPSVDGTTVTLNFTQVTGKTEPNKPYLLKVTNDGRGGTAYFVDNSGDTEKKLSFSDIEDKKEIDGQTAEDGNVTATLFGTYVTQTFTPDTETKTSEVYGLKQDNDNLTLVSSSKRSVLPAFRAAVKIEKLPARAKYIVLSFDGETTGISPIGNDTVTSILGNVYSIDGRLVGNANSGLVHLPAGLYIVNGKKVVIK